MGSGTDDKRKALRVPCEFPVQVYGQMREFAGRMVNISRTGVRFRLPLSGLLDPAHLDFAALSRAVSQMLGNSFLADLHYEMLGQLVRRKLHLVRVGYVDAALDEIEFGCTFDEPLRDEETVMLGVGLPPVGETSPAAYRSVTPPRHVGDSQDEVTEGQPRPVGYEGILHATEGYITKPLVGVTSGVVSGEVQFIIPVRRFQDLQAGGEGRLLDVLRLEFGAAPRAEILDGLHMVWAGPVELTGLEMPMSLTGDAVLTLRTA